MRHGMCGTWGSRSLAKAGSTVSGTPVRRPVASASTSSSAASMPHIVVMPVVGRRGWPRRTGRRRPWSQKLTYNTVTISKSVAKDWQTSWVLTTSFPVPLRRTLMFVLYNFNHIGHRVREANIVVQMWWIPTSRRGTTLHRRGVPTSTHDQKDTNLTSHRSPSRVRSSTTCLYITLNSVIFDACSGSYRPDVNVADRLCSPSMDGVSPEHPVVPSPASDMLVKSVTDYRLPALLIKLLVIDVFLCISLNFRRNYANFVKYLKQSHSYQVP